MKDDDSNYKFSVKDFLRDEPKGTIRTNQCTAKSLLLNNESIIIGGNVRYFIMKYLGLGVYEIGLRAPGRENTYTADTDVWIEERKWIG